MIGGGGTNTVQLTDQSTGEQLAGVTPFPIEGAMPPLDASAKTPFKPEAPCENQDPPDLSALPGPPPDVNSVPAGAEPAAGSSAAPLVDDAGAALKGLADASQAKQDGDKPGARELQRRAIKDLGSFYRRWGSGAGG